MLNLVLIAVAVLIVAPWLIRKAYIRSGDRIVVVAPELESAPSDQRGALWLNAVGKTLLQWQVVTGLVILVAVAAGLIVLFGDSVADRWHSVFVFFVLLVALFAARPLIVRRARAVLTTELNNRSDDGE